MNKNASSIDRGKSMCKIGAKTTERSEASDYLSKAASEKTALWFKTYASGEACPDRIQYCPRCGIGRAAALAVEAIRDGSKT